MNNELNPMQFINDVFSDFLCKMLILVLFINSKENTDKNQRSKPATLFIKFINK
jgi:hypothetical protein